MQINSSQYQQAMTGKFLSRVAPEVDEQIMLIMPTPRGRRHLPVGKVLAVREVCPGRCLIEVADLKPVEGFY